MNTHIPHAANHPARAGKIVTAAEAVRLIHDGDTVATGGFEGKVRLFDVATGKLRKEFPPAPIAPLSVGTSAK